MKVEKFDTTSSVTWGLFDEVEQMIILTMM